MSYQVPTPTHFCSKVPSWRSLSTKFCQSNKYLRCHPPLTSVIKVKRLKLLKLHITPSIRTYWCTNNTPKRWASSVTQSQPFFWAAHTNIHINMWSKGILSGWGVQCECQGTQCTSEYTVYPEMGYTAPFSSQLRSLWITYWFGGLCAQPMKEKTAVIV